MEYVIGDLHLGDKRIGLGIGFRNDIKCNIEYRKLIKDNWNSVVGVHDTVYVVGDTFSSAIRDPRHPLISFFKNELNGKKVVLIGNHDNIQMLVKANIDVRLCVTISRFKVLLTHIPVHPRELVHKKERYSFNIHGHFHKESIDDFRYFCASCERINYTPKLLTSIASEFNLLRPHFDISSESGAII
jgi:calcineurin-like phosphoesterase family protein